MTTEQLDEIEKLADGWHRTGLTQYAEEVADNGRALVKALREALAEVERLRAELKTQGDEKAESFCAAKLRGWKGQPTDSTVVLVSSIMHDLLGVRAALNDSRFLREKAAAERDEARAEVERLREAARQVHALAEAAVAGTAVGAWLQVQQIHKITKGMVE